MVIRNFLFHRVSDEKDAMWPPMTVDLFKKIIRHLAENFLVVPLESYLDDPGAFQTKRKIATVLFDDGFKDNIEYAAPVLQMNQCPASFYVVTDCIDNNIPTWTYLIDNALASTKKNRLEFSHYFFPEKFRKIDLSTSRVKEIKPWMKTLDNARRKSITGFILDECDDVPIPRTMMSWNDIRQLQSAGFVMGSHSDTHPMMASLANEEDIINELRVSAARLKSETGITPVTISYPIGSYDERVIRNAKEEGYRYGLAVKQRFYNTEKDGLFEIPRVELYQEPWWKVKMRISGVYSTLKKVWR